MPPYLYFDILFICIYRDILYIYIYVYIYIYICVYIYICISMYTYTYEYIYIYTYTKHFDIPLVYIICIIIPVDVSQIYWCLLITWYSKHCHWMIVPNQIYHFYDPLHPPWFWGQAERFTGKGIIIIWIYKLDLIPCK